MNEREIQHDDECGEDIRLYGCCRHYCPTGEHTDLDPDGRAVAQDREETKVCQAGTPGCCIDHSADHGPCETW